VGEAFPLRRGENVVGREQGDIVFPSDAFVSGRHARIDIDESAIQLSDLGSANGTYVKIAGRIPLQAGDQVLVGMQLLTVESI
jgi:pSer/pThr/pTyr-binding forkhead associated (FHA) protein